MGKSGSYAGGIIDQPEASKIEKQTGPVIVSMSYPMILFEAPRVLVKNHYSRGRYRHGAAQGGADELDFAVAAGIGAMLF